MRKEASLEQWGALYETATRLKERKPWEKFWDMDLIGVRKGAAEDTVFFSILGRGGDCYGITVYKGYDGLNRYLMMLMRERMELSVDFTMFNQKNLTCYWGNRDELTDKQRKVIKDLGYTYRGKNQWLYFMSYEPGYWPYNLDEEEVLRMSGYLRDLETALEYYDRSDAQVDFKNGNMFLATFDEEKGAWNFGEEPLPFVEYRIRNLIITDDELLSDLSKAPKCEAVLEADISALGASVTDKKYDRPANPALPLLGNAGSGTILKFEMPEPEEDPMVSLADMVIGFIFRYGSPKEIRVSNDIIGSGLAQICEVCKIKLRRVKRLPGLESFKQGMGRFNL